VQPSSSESVNILTYGYDAVLLDTRSLLLDQAGYHAESVATPEEFEAAIAARGSDFDLLILCHTVPEQEQEVISASVERSKTALYRVPALVPPSDFLAHVSALLD
jgi:hypothetical protein